jgi:hypothetical protein
MTGESGKTHTVAYADFVPFDWAHECFKAIPFEKKT